MSTPCIQYLWDEKKIWNDLELELQLVVSSYEGAGNQTQFLWKNS